MNDNETDHIQKRIDKFETVVKKNDNIKNGNLAFNIAVELVAGAIIGIIIGLFIDNLFDSKPLFLVICIIISFVAAFKTIWQKMQKKNGS